MDCSGNHCRFDFDFDFNVAFCLFSFLNKMNLQKKVADLFMVGSIYAKRLEKLNIKNVENLLYHFPFRYDDYSLISPVNKVQPGETVTIKGTLIEIKNQYIRHGRKIQKAQVSDKTGQMEITWGRRGKPFTRIGWGSFEHRLWQIGRMKTR